MPSAPYLGLREWLDRVRRYVGLEDLRPIRWILIAGLAVRIALLPLSAHPWDVYVWYLTGNRIYSGGGLYGGAAYTYSYPPVWGGFLAVTDGLYRILAPAIGVHPITATQASAILGKSTNLGTPLVVDWLFATFVKAPLVVFDFLTAVLLYRIVRVRLHRPDLAGYAAGLFFLNPFVILISSVWGQFDIIATYFLILGTLLYLDGHALWAGVLWGLSVATKYFPVVIALAVVAAYWSRRPRGDALRSLVAMVAVVGAISLPFLLTDASAYIGGVTGPTRGTPGTESLSIWSYLSNLAPSLVPGGSDFVPELLILIVGLAMVAGWLIGRAGARGRDETVWIDTAVVGLLIFYLVYRTVNEQYLIWVMPFLALEVARRRTSWVVYGLLSGLLVTDCVFSINGTSFFLPSLTLSHSLGRWFSVEQLPPLGTAFAMATWGTVLVVLLLQVQGLLERARPPPVLRVRVRAAHPVPAPEAGVPPTGAP